MYHHDCFYYCRGRPPLYYAIEFQLSSVVSLLLPGTDQVNSFAFGHTALHVAAKYGALELAIELLSRGAEIDLKSESYQRGKTALHYAAEAGHIEVIRLLLESGASVRARSISGSTPLYAAARSGSIKALNLLLDAGANINIQTHDGWTPLFEAVAQCRRQIACRLLRLGADPILPTFSGESVLTVIARSLTEGARRAMKPSMSTPEDVLREIKEIQKSNKVEENTDEPFLRLFKYLHYGMSIYLTHTDLDTRAGTERDKCRRFGESVCVSCLILFLDLVTYHPYRDHG
jgi:ankyrin repeat protein